jgi:LacI family transcriptional regulator
MKRIALGMGLSDYYDHGIARGIVKYARNKPDWRLYGQGWMFSPLEDLSAWDGDGVIVRLEYAEQIPCLSGLACPVVDVANAFGVHRICRVHNDDYETGRLAGRHFKEKGFSSFAFCGTSHGEWSRQRLAGFMDETGQHRMPVFLQPLRWWLRESFGTELSSFLAGLSGPVGLFTCNDKVGLRVSSVCGAEGFDVPERVAILGVDNEDIPCELANPPLSSIALDLERIGVMASVELEALMNSRGATRRSEKSVKIPPVGIIERESTSSYASCDPLVVAAFRLIRGSDGHRKRVADLVHELASGRRSLEIRFKRETGQTLHQALTAQKIRVAGRILRSTDKTMEAVAGESGFGSAQRFFTCFREQTGMTPAEFRRKGGRYGE